MAYLLISGFAVVGRTACIHSVTSGRVVLGGTLLFGVRRSLRREVQGGEV